MQTIDEHRRMNTAHLLCRYTIAACTFVRCSVPITPRTQQRPERLSSAYDSFVHSNACISTLHAPYMQSLLRNFTFCITHVTTPGLLPSKRNVFLPHNTVPGIIQQDRS